jgi:hypothetical protein
VKRVHPEFAYQSRELEGQVEGILGDPPNKKNYKMMVDALVSEYASGSGIEDVNMMAFALVDHIKFKDPKGLMAQAAQYDSRKPEPVFAMAECTGDAAEMYAAMTFNHPELARQAIITAFLYKHPRGWVDEDQSLDQLAEGDEGDDDDVEDGMVSEDFSNLFDQEEE